MADRTPRVQDLDILRPPPEYVRLSGKDIDISFVPAGVALEMMVLQDQLDELADTPEKIERLQNNRELALRMFDVQAEYCAKLTSAQYPEMDKAWLLRNTSVRQLKILINQVTRAVMQSLDTVEDEEIKKAAAVGEPSP